MMGTEYEGRKLDLEELLELSEGDSLKYATAACTQRPRRRLKRGLRP